MKKDRLPKILKGLLTCAAIAVGLAVLVFLGIIALFFVLGLLLTSIISRMPH